LRGTTPTDAGSGKPGITEEATPHPNSPRALLEKFLQPGADLVKLTAALKPRDVDYAAIFTDEYVGKARESYEPLWSDPSAAMGPKEGQTALLIWPATSEEIKTWTGDAKEQFPGGWQKVGPALQDDLIFYRFKFVKPGETLGMAFDGLVYVNGRWVIVPKPYPCTGSVNAASLLRGVRPPRVAAEGQYVHRPDDHEPADTVCYLLAHGRGDFVAGTGLSPVVWVARRRFTRRAYQRESKDGTISSAS